MASPVTPLQQQQQQTPTNQQNDEAAQAFGRMIAQICTNQLLQSNSQAMETIKSLGN